MKVLKILNQHRGTEQRVIYHLAFQFQKARKSGAGAFILKGGLFQKYERGAKKHIGTVQCVDRSFPL